MLSRIAETLKKQKSVNIITHVNPDGDALGSSFALKFILGKCGITANVVLDKPVPGEFEFTGWQAVVGTENAEKADCVVGVDFGELSRTPCGEVFEKAPLKIIIDHHIVKEETGDLFFSNPGAAACSENIFEIMKILGTEADEDIATALYIAIMTDTGGCRFGNTTKNTHLILAELIDYVDHAYINRMVFDVMSREKFKARQIMLQRLETYADGKINVFAADKSFENEDDLNGLVNIAVNLEGAQAGVLLKQKDENKVKVSLRTTGDINAAEICKYFGGGGHKNAAGATIEADMETAKNQLVEEIEKRIIYNS